MDGVLPTFQDGLDELYKNLNSPKVISEMFDGPTISVVDIIEPSGRGFLQHGHVRVLNNGKKYTLYWSKHEGFFELCFDW